MERNNNSEQLRALFRELFKIELKSVCKDIGFLGKMGATKINQQRMSDDQRKWLIGIGVLTPDAKNIIDIDDRTIFSHIISAVYAGLYGLNFVDVTSHCLETIKQKQGLPQNCNLVDHLSPKEIRQFSIALYRLSNEIRQQKNRGNFMYATMGNFYKIADMAFTCGLNTKHKKVFEENSEFFVNTTASQTKAANTLKSFTTKLKYGKFCYENMQPNSYNQDKQLLEDYRNAKNELDYLLTQKNYTSTEKEKIYTAIEEGYYQTKFFRNYPYCMAYFMDTKPLKISEADLKAQTTKLVYAKVLLQKFYKRASNKPYTFDCVLNTAYTGGLRAREDCQFKNKTSPEYLSSFAQALVLHKEREY